MTISAKFKLPLALLGALVMTGPALGYPPTKLTAHLEAPILEAMWCSSLLLEQSYLEETDSDKAFYYDELAYTLGLSIDVILTSEHALNHEEVAEIWEIFDDEAWWFSMFEEQEFQAAVTLCEHDYDDLLS